MSGRWRSGPFRSVLVGIVGAVLATVVAVRVISEAHGDATILIAFWEDHLTTAPVITAFALLVFTHPPNVAEPRSEQLHRRGV